MLGRAQAQHSFRRGDLPAATLLKPQHKVAMLQQSIIVSVHIGKELLEEVSVELEVQVFNCEREFLVVYLIAMTAVELPES